jgi:Aromatic-ring-opening dioxygenase LigAB, LigA subunit
MSLYQLNKIMYLLEVDSTFLAKMKADPPDAIKDMPLSEDERAAVIAGDVGKLYAMGVNCFMMDSIARHQLYGIDRQGYLDRVRAAAAAPGAQRRGQPHER